MWARTTVIILNTDSQLVYLCVFVVGISHPHGDKPLKLKDHWQSGKAWWVIHLTDARKKCVMQKKKFYWKACCVSSIWKKGKGTNNYIKALIWSSVWFHRNPRRAPSKEQPCCTTTVHMTSPHASWSVLFSEILSYHKVLSPESWKNVTLWFRLQFFFTQLTFGPLFALLTHFFKNIIPFQNECTTF